MLRYESKFIEYSYILFIKIHNNIFICVIIFTAIKI